MWRLAFRIRFPRVTSDGRPTISPAAKWFGLRFAGAQGNSELNWQMSADGADTVEPAPDPGSPAPASPEVPAPATPGVTEASAKPLP